MTLIVAIRYAHGTVLATEGRVMFGMGGMKRDQARKIVPFTDSIVAAAAGLTGAIDDITKQVKEIIRGRDADFDEVASVLSDMNWEWWNANKKKLTEDEQTQGPDFVIVSKDRIRRE